MIEACWRRHVGYACLHGIKSNEQIKLMGGEMYSFHVLYYYYYYYLFGSMIDKYICYKPPLTLLPFVIISYELFLKM